MIINFDEFQIDHLREILRSHLFDVIEKADGACVASDTMEVRFLLNELYLALELHEHCHLPHRFDSIPPATREKPKKGKILAAASSVPAVPPNSPPPSAKVVPLRP